jgi:hypothetical protein
MSTFRLPIVTQGALPDSSGEVFFEPYSVKATNDLLGGLVLIMNDSATRNGIRGNFQIPQNYVGSAKIIIDWTATATTGDVEFDFDYRAIAVGETLDQATVQETVNINDTAPAAIHERQTAELTLTSANLVVGDQVLFELFRDGTDAGDTMAAAAIVFGVYFEYSDV